MLKVPLGAKHKTHVLGMVSQWTLSGVTCLFFPPLLSVDR